MSSRVKSKEEARARAAKIRAAKAQAERRRNIMVATSAIAVVIVIVGGLVLAKVLKGDDSGSTSAAKPKSSTTLPGSVLAEVTSVPTATFDRVGATGVTSAPASIKARALTADGKPEVLYIGAEYCPYCAAERWPMAIAMSRFGTWSGLGAAESSAKDVFPSTQTLSFHGATLTSDVLTFHGYETSDTNQKPLDTVSAADQLVFDNYNKPPYIEQAGGIPFIDIGGTYVTSGASFTPGLLEGKTRAQIAKAINDPSSKIGEAVIGNANVLTAAICKVTGDKPANVCTSPGVKAGAAGLLTSQPSK
jgi:Domain of unknown function (DUF929)